MNTPKPLVQRLLRLALLLVSTALVAYLLYFHKLGSLLPGYAQVEVDSLKAAADWHIILQNPVNAPYKAVVWLLTAVFDNGIIATRIVAASFATLLVLAFFFVVRRRFNYWVALVSSLLFATSSGFLHSARLGTPQILQMSILVLIGAILWYKSLNKYRTLAGYAIALIFGLLWYVPGLFWLELLGVVILSKNIIRQVKRTPVMHISGWLALFIITLIPLLIASVEHSVVALQALGLPTQLHSLSHFGSNLVSTVLAIGIRSPGNPLVWVGHAPLLNVIELVLVAIGVYERVYVQRTSRATLIIGLATLTVLLIAVGGGVTVACLIPLLYMFVAEGVNQFIKQWFTVFPRNPIARSMGGVLLGVMVFFSVLYQGRLYFIAWPHNSNTRQEFNKRVE